MIRDVSNQGAEPASGEPAAHSAHHADKSAHARAGAVAVARIASAPAPTPHAMKLVQQALGPECFAEPATDPEHALTYKEMKGQPFVRSDGEARDIQPNDVEQGNLGDCWFLAGCAAVARANPEAIRRLIHDNGDGTYNVTLYRSDGFLAPPTPHTLRLDSKFPVTATGGIAYAQSADTASNGNIELWVMLLEKAYAMMHGGYERGMTGGHGHEGITSLTGAAVALHVPALTFEEDILTQMSQALAAHHPVTAGSLGGLDKSEQARANAAGFTPGHTYAVRLVDVHKKTVSLQDPTGVSPLNDLPIHDFKRWFGSYYIGNKAA